MNGKAPVPACIGSVTDEFPSRPGPVGADGACLDGNHRRWSTLRSGEGVEGKGSRVKFEIRLIAVMSIALLGVAACGSDNSLGSPTSLPPLPPIVPTSNPALVPTSLVVLPATTVLPPTTPPPVVILDPPTTTIGAPPPTTIIGVPPATTTPPAPAPPPPDPQGGPIETGCVRPNIDFAAVREAPGVAQAEVGRIPPGTCDVPIYAEGSDGRIAWLQVGIGGTFGWSARSNFVQDSIQPTT